MAINRHGVELGVMVGIVNVLIFRHNLPAGTDVAAVPPFNADVEKAERLALMECTAFTLLVAGFARNLETFIIGGSIVLATDFSFKYLNAVNPMTGAMAGAPATGSSSAHPLPDYQMTG